MFSKYKKTETPNRPHPASPPPRADRGTPNTPARAQTVEPARTPARPAAPDKEAKRREKLTEVKVELHKALLENLNLSALEHASEQDLRAEISAICAESLNDMGFVLNKEERATLHQDLYDEVTGLGPIEPLLKDDTVNDILINGPKSIFVERDGKLEKSPITFRNEKHLLRIIDKIVSAVGRRVDESNPYVDARLAGRLAFQRHGATDCRGWLVWCRFVSLKRTSWAFDDLVKFGAFSEEMADVPRKPLLPDASERDRLRRYGFR